jgi:hypothetical protein
MHPTAIDAANESFFSARALFERAYRDIRRRPDHPQREPGALLEARREWDRARLYFEEIRARLQFAASVYGRIGCHARRLEDEARMFARAHEALLVARAHRREAARALHAEGKV